MDNADTDFPLSESVARSKALSFFVFGTLTALSGLSCILGTYYDDEIFSINWAALKFETVLDYVRYINSHDIHPPASYLLNKLTFGTLGNWKSVQFFNGAVNAAAIAWFHFSAVGSITKSERNYLTFVLATAVSSEMWGTGLRWNAYFNPAFLVLYTVALSSRPPATARAAILAIGSVFLFHTSYLAIVALPILWLTFTFRSFEELRSQSMLEAALLFVAAIIACLPQLNALMNEHLTTYVATHPSSILYSTLQSTSNLILGSAVFPVDYLPDMYAGMLTIAFVASLRLLISDRYVAMLLCSTLLGIVLLILSRLGVEGRNAMFLYPISLTLTVVAISRSVTWIRLPATGLLILFQAMSAYNFVFHYNTSKGSFNTPFARTMHEIANLTTACHGQTYVFTHEPVLTYLLQENGNRVSSPYAPSTEAARPVKEYDCVAVVHTYRGTIPPELFNQYAKFPNLDHLQKTMKIDLGYDRFHSLKSIIVKDAFPDYYISIVAYNVLEDTLIADWCYLSTKYWQSVE